MPISNAIIKKVSDATPITNTVNLITAAQGSSPYAIIPGTLSVSIYGVVPDIDNKKVSFEYFATVLYTANGTEYLAHVDGSTSAEGIDLPDLCAAVGAMPIVSTVPANNSVTVDEFGAITFNIYYAIDYKKCEETLVSLDMGAPVV